MVACCAFALGRFLGRVAIWNKQPRISKALVDAIMQGLFYQTPAIRGTCYFNTCNPRPSYRKWIWNFNAQFRKLIRRIAGPSPGQMGRCKGMIFCMGSPVPMKFLPSQSETWFNSGSSRCIFQIDPPNAWWRDHLRRNRFQHIFRRDAWRHLGKYYNRKFWRLRGTCSANTKCKNCC